MKKLIFLFLGLVAATYSASCVMVIPETDEEAYSRPVLIEEPVTVQVINVYYMDAGLILVTEGTVMTSSPESIDTYILQIEEELASLEAERQSMNTMFQNFENNVNQVFNTLSNILKTMHDIEQGIVRNIGR